MDHLDDDQISQLKSSLQQAKAEIEEQLQALANTTKPVDLNEPIGRLSRMDALQAQGLALEQKKRTEVRLNMVNAALSRMEKGTYGVCIRSGEPIPFARLSVVPELPVFLTVEEDD